MIHKNTILTNAIWRIGERIGASAVTFIVSIVLARILSPKEYGLISLVLVMTTLLQVFVDSGMGKALIQKKATEKIDYSTVFVFNLFSSIFLYAVLYFCSPMIESFFGYEKLAEVIQISGIILIISAAKNVVQAYVMKQMKFKLFFMSTLMGTILSGVIALIMAYKDCGVWALVAQQIINPLVDTLILWIVIEWRPRIKFSFKSFKELYSYAWKLLAVDLLNEFFNSIRTIFIGKFFDASELGFYENGRKLPASIYSNIDSSLRSVIFPVFAKEQDDILKTKNYMLKMINVCYYVTTPVLFGLIGCSENIVRFIFTDKWLSAVPYMQIACVVWFLNSIQAINQQVVLAKGRSDICLKIEIINKVMTFVALIICVKYGVFAIALSQVFISVIGVYLNLYPNRKLINCTIVEQLNCCFIEVFVNVIMLVFVYLIGCSSIDYRIELILQILAGVFIYVIFSIIFKLNGYMIIKSFLLSKIKREVNNNE